MGVMHLERERERALKCRRKIARKIAKEAHDYHQDGGLVQPLLGAEAGAGYAKAGAFVCTGLSKAGTVVAATALGPMGIGILGGVAVAGLMLGAWKLFTKV